VGGTPVFIERGEGPYLIDTDGNRYIDYIGSWGPLILGHAHPEVVRAIEEAARRGSSFGCPTEGEIEMAELLCDAVGSLDVVRLVSSGTEATMSAIRLARGATGRSRIVKFEGCYHGHSDALLAKAGSGLATFGIPGTPGVPPNVVRDTITLPFNDSTAFLDLVESEGDSIAAVIVEPVGGNMGCVTPRPGFLEGLREGCDQCGALLIFDEVMTGFRVAWGGAQAMYDVRPDLTTLGKVIGGGLPVGAYGGREDLMRQMAPDGPVYQAGTLSGNPIAISAGLATLRVIRDDENFYPNLAKLAKRLVEGLLASARRHSIALTGTSVGGMLGLFFTDLPVRDYEGARAADIGRYGRYFHGLLDRGVYMAPSAFEVAFVSSAHSEAVIDDTIEKADQVFGELRE
jgi:glutamate-1-semialdehyde 2,1-aminomutase